MRFHRIVTVGVRPREDFLAFYNLPASWSSRGGNEMSAQKATRDAVPVRTRVAQSQPEAGGWAHLRSLACRPPHTQPCQKGRPLGSPPSLCQREALSVGGKADLGSPKADTNQTSLSIAKEPSVRCGMTLLQQTCFARAWLHTIGLVVTPPARYSVARVLRPDRALEKRGDARVLAYQLRVTS
ncbi:MAG: hypothetical protein JWN48_4860 [Myxococcaceae bacterium]|nr:hypothetical protein [Myxococcaceae bacterium]